MKKGSSLKVVKTNGKSLSDYDLYNIEGLSLGKLELIRRTLKDVAQHSELAAEIVAAIEPIDEKQTIGGK